MDNFPQNLQEHDSSSNQGIVYLIGAGPGDVELLTLQAVRILKLVDLILIDSLVNPEVLQFARPDAQIINVGKGCGKKSTPQPVINDLMVNNARLGKKIARLKGGDPFIFGRGGEELEYLHNNAIKTQIISGITSGSNVPACLGIPLTHRDYAQSVIFITGSSKNHTVNVVWKDIAKPDNTIVIFMGLFKIKEIVTSIIEAGMPALIPAAAIENGSRKYQRQILACLKDLPELVNKAQFISPTLIVIGKVVTLSPLWKTENSSSTSSPLINSQSVVQL